MNTFFRSAKNTSQIVTKGHEPIPASTHSVTGILWHAWMLWVPAVQISSTWQDCQPISPVHSQVFSWRSTYSGDFNLGKSTLLDHVRNSCDQLCLHQWVRTVYLTRSSACKRAETTRNGNWWNMTGLYPRMILSPDVTGTFWNPGTPRSNVQSSKPLQHRMYT